MPNFFVPIVQQGQQGGQRPGGRRGSGPVQQPQQTMPLIQQQVRFVLKLWLVSCYWLVL